MRFRKTLCILLLCAGLALGALLAAIGTEAARWPSRDARLKQTQARVRESRDHFYRLVTQNASEGELEQAAQEMHKVEQEEMELEIQRTYSWHARLRREIRRRTGW